MPALDQAERSGLYERIAALLPSATPETVIDQILEIVDEVSLNAYRSGLAESSPKPAIPHDWGEDNVLAAGW